MNEWMFGSFIFVYYLFVLILILLLVACIPSWNVMVYSHFFFVFVPYSSLLIACVCVCINRVAIPNTIWQVVPTGQFGTAIRQWWDEALIRHVLICCKSVKSITTIKLPLQKQITLPPVVRNCRRIQWRPIVRHCRANRRFDWRANACKWPTQGIVYHLWWSLIIIIIHRASIAVWMLLASHSPDYHAAMQSSRRHNAAHQQIILGSAPKKGTGSNTWRWSPPLLWTNWRNEEQDIETASCRSQESHRHCEWYCEEPV